MIKLNAKKFNEGLKKMRKELTPLEQYQQSVTETKVKKQIKEYLYIEQAAGRLFHFHILQGLGCFAGSPDRVLILPKGITIWLEVKKVMGKMSPAQKNFREQCQNFGHHYLVVFSVDDLITNLNCML